MIYAGVILAALWLLQIVFLDNYYQSMKQSRLIKAGELVAQKIGEVMILRIPSKIWPSSTTCPSRLWICTPALITPSTPWQGSIISSIFGYQTFSLRACFR
jgi:hypothetical protein